jgi:DNA-binding transcriptional regulator PaaX
MPKSNPTPDALPSNDLILAAIERAICHRGRNEPGESLSTIKEHLALPHTGWTTLKLRPKLQELEAAGLIEQSRRSSHNVWGLTSKGRKRLNAVRTELTLPEAPQHRRWRDARAAAGERIAGFRADLRAALDRATNLLDTDEDTDSATWFELSERLNQAGRLLASATYCLRDWAEPDDAHPDLDNPPYTQRGRRHIGSWDSKFRF